VFLVRFLLLSLFILLDSMFWVQMFRYILYVLTSYNHGRGSELGYFRSISTTTFLIALIFLSSFTIMSIIPPTMAEEQTWRDDFNYQTTTEMINSGWEIKDQSLVAVGDGKLEVSDNTRYGYDYNVYYPLSQNDLTYFRVETSSSLISGGDGGDVFMLVKVNGRDIIWGRGYIKIDNSQWMIDGVTSDLNDWDTFTIEYSNQKLYFYYNDELKYSMHTDPWQIKANLDGIALSATGLASAKYDYLNVLITPFEKYHPENSVPHESIRIEDESDFTSDNGVTAGSGTRSNPFIIENWIINVEGSQGIFIGNTNSYFTIRNCLIVGCSEAIHIESNNGLIEDNIIIGDDDWETEYNDATWGIELYGNYNTIRGNTILNTGLGLEILADDNIVYNNNFVNTLVSVSEDVSVVTWHVLLTGNYWGDYTGVDSNKDGIGDTPYIIDANNQDVCPIMNMRFPDFDGDGIYNDLDTEPLEFSFYYSDYFKNEDLARMLWGYIYRNDLTVTIKDEPAPYGISFKTGSTGDEPSPYGISSKADSTNFGLVWTVSTIGNYTFEPNSEVVLSYGSAHVKVNQGHAKAEYLLPDNNRVTIILATGDEIVFEPETALLTNNGQNIIIVSAFNTEFAINPGESVSFTSDIVPPTTSATLSSASIPIEDWYQSDVEVTLTPTDPALSSGMAETSYSFDKQNWITYTSPFAINARGTTTIYYRSIDKAGNIESTKTVIVQIAMVTSGNQKITLTGSENGVIVTNGNNIIDAKQAATTTIVKTGNGNNKIYLGEGDNIVKIIGNGNDIITTGDGDNVMIISGNGNRQITTGKGNDNIILSGTGNNIINSGDGDNKVVVGNGNNQIIAGSGNDVVAAGNGNNNIISGSANDQITVGNGNNYIDGGKGVDTCRVGQGKNKIINCEL
jgi:hypothetical protein